MDGSTTIYQKVASVMGDLGRIPKNGYNKDQNYAFVTAEDVKDSLREVMASHNLAMLVSLDEYEVAPITSRSGTTGQRVRGKFCFTLACGDTGETLDRYIWAEVLDWQDKAFSKLFTAGVKTFLINTFLISTGNEDDPDLVGDDFIDPEPATKHYQAKPQKSPPDPLAKLAKHIREVYLEVQKQSGNYYSAPAHLYNALGKQWPEDTEEAKEEAIRQGVLHALDRAGDNDADENLEV